MRWRMGRTCTAAEAKWRKTRRIRRRKCGKRIGKNIPTEAKAATIRKQLFAFMIDFRSFSRKTEWARKKNAYEIKAPRDAPKSPKRAARNGQRKSWSREDAAEATEMESRRPPPREAHMGMVARKEKGTVKQRAGTAASPSVYALGARREKISGAW